MAARFRTNRNRWALRLGNQASAKLATQSPSPPALYECVITHVRMTPVRHRFAHRTYQWLVDVDDLPSLPWFARALARFNAADHGGKSGDSMRRAVEDFLLPRSIDVRGGKILALTHARSFGYVFNPLTVYWCYDRTGAFSCTVAEIHNTYGEHYFYVVRPDAKGYSTFAKALRVSPFLPLAGTYRVSLPEPGIKLKHTVVLYDESGPLLIAVNKGTKREATVSSLLILMLKYPLVPLRTTLAIRRQGLRLWVILRKHRTPARQTRSSALAKE